MPQNLDMIRANVRCVRQGIELLLTLENAVYELNEHRYFSSGVGKHMRHIIDHYECLLLGMESGSVDYDQRERNLLIETDADYAGARLRTILQSLESLGEGRTGQPETLRVRSNEAPGTDPGQWSRSTPRRELQFLVGHTVHHYALIAIMLRLLGVQVPEDFGVAPSTLQFMMSSGM